MNEHGVRGALGENVSAQPALTVCRWDLDKTYLVSHLESLRHLLKIPFEKATDKQAVPGVIELIRAMRRAALVRGERQQVYFISASPPQIGGAIKEKLLLDGIEYEGISFKRQVHHLVRGRLDVLREQIGYKLGRLLAAAGSTRESSRDLLFGDDWESDPLIYSLYADILAGRVDSESCLRLLRRARVHRDYLEEIEKQLERLTSPIRVENIFILRQGMRPASDLEAFGPRLSGLDNYLECALLLYAQGLLDLPGVEDVARGVGGHPAANAASFEAVASRRRGMREKLSPARSRLLRSGLMLRVGAGSPVRRLLEALRRRFGSAPGRSTFDFVPDYEALIDSWSRAGRRERHDARS
ncbi:MAG: hypothetical protein ACE5E4_00160 [Candidatus Binatia bacterium]